jgi:hypothetical protein
MNIVVQNRRNVEFDLADLDVHVKEFIDDAGVIVRTQFVYHELVLPD